MGVFLGGRTVNMFMRKGGKILLRGMTRNSRAIQDAAHCCL